MQFSARTERQGLERMAHDLQQIAEGAEHAAKAAAQAGEDRLGDVRQTLHDGLHELRVRLDDLEQAAAYRTRRALRHTDHAVRAHPYRAIGIAVAAGVLVGLLTARR